MHFQPGLSPQWAGGAHDTPDPRSADGWEGYTPLIPYPTRCSILSPSSVATRALIFRGVEVGEGSHCLEIFFIRTVPVCVVVICSLSRLQNLKSLSALLVSLNSAIQTPKRGATAPYNEGGWSPLMLVWGPKKAQMVNPVLQEVIFS